MPGFELFNEEEKKHINDVLDSGILMRYGFDNVRNNHWKSKELEWEIQQKFKVNFAQLTSSGTAALTTALAIAGIGANDEVIIPCFTFVASFEAILSVGAIPVLVEIDNSLTINPVAIQLAITPKTKAIMPVHMCGSMADIDSLKTICAKNNLLLIEDACQSIGATYKGQYLGTIGDIGTFSFDFVKTITCGEGGVVLTNNKKYYTNADAFSDHGHDHLGVDRGADNHPFIGYNFRISELHAAIGLAQINKLEKILSIQRKNHTLLKQYIATINGIEFRKIYDETGDSCTFLTWMLPDEKTTIKAIEALKKNNIFAGNFYWYINNWHYIKKWDHLKNGVSLFPMNNAQIKTLHKLKKTTFVESDKIMCRTVSTAISLNWTEDQIKEKGEKMVSIINSII